MPGFLKNFFKSKRPAPEVQKPLDIAQLDPKRPKDQEALFNLVTTEGASDRQINAALTKTGDLDIIVRWYVDAPKAVQVQIADWVARQPSNPKRMAQARGRLSDPQLQQIFDQLSGAGPATTSQEPASPRSLGQLEELAIAAKTSQARQEAVAQIDDEAGLQRIAKAAKGRDKRVYQIARQKLQSQREENAKRVALNAELDQLIDQGEAHARTESTQLYQARFETLNLQWAKLENAATEQQRARFNAAQAQCQSRCDQMAVAAEAVATAKVRGEERQATLALLRTTLDQLQRANADQIPGASSLDAMQKTQENRWIEATRDSEVGRQEQKDYERLMQGLRLYLHAIRNFEAQRPALQAMLETDATPAAFAQAGGESAQLASAVAAIDWPTGYPMPALLAQAQAQHEIARAHTATASPEVAKAADTSQLEGLLTELERTLEDKDLKASRKLLKEAQQSAERLPERQRRSYQGRLALLTRQVQDLQDWLGFATRPKQEALCDQMEQLAGQPLDPELKAAKIHQLQEQWRELGGSSEQMLWQRFKQAADLAFAPCQDYFAARNELKAANHHKREQICEELSMFISQLDWAQCDWRGVEKIHRKARQEWRDAKPIDFRINREVQRRFDELLKELDARLDAERARNEAAKTEIIEHAQALADHEPLGDAIAEAKALQRQWEGIGITHQKQDRALWQAFRAACDALFARRDSQRAEQQAQTSEQVTTARELLDNVEQQLQAPANASTLAAIQESLSAFRQINLSGGQGQHLEQRCQALQQRLDSQLRDAAQQAQRQAWVDQLQTTGSEGGDPAEQRELCIRAEILAGIESPDADRNHRMTLQVERLAAGMGRGQNFPDTRAEMEHLLSRWQEAAGPVADPALIARMEAAIDALQR